MKLLVVTSPTGGHLIPASILARKAEHQDHDVTLVSNQQLNLDWVPGSLTNIERIEAKPWVGQSLVGRIRSLGTAVGSYLQSRELITGVDAVVGFGGFVTVTVLIACMEQGIPFYLHEQNRMPGRTTRVFGPFAQKVFYGFPPLETISGSGSVVGTPIRSPGKVTDDWWEDSPVLVVVGGSQGARELTRMLSRGGEGLLKMGWSIYHLYGAYGEDLKDQFDQYQDQYRGREFDPELPAKLSRATVIWSRAGAGTLSEIIAYDRPALLFPYPYAADDHQRHNAEFVASHGPARMVESGVSGEQLLEWTFRYSDKMEGYRWKPPAEVPAQAMLDAIVP